MTLHAAPVMHHEFTGLSVLLTGIHANSYTFQMVQDNTDTHWYFQRFNLIHEYYERPWLPPPFIIFIHIYMLFMWCKRHCNHRPLSSDFSEYAGSFIYFRITGFALTANLLYFMGYDKHIPETQSSKSVRHAGCYFVWTGLKTTTTKTAQWEMCVCVCVCVCVFASTASL